MDEKGVYVYVIEQAGGDYIKVGIAHNMKLRLKGLQNGNPQKLRVHFTITLPSRREAESAERHAHGLLREHRCEGEWFSCGVRTAKAAVMRAAAGLGHAPKHTPVSPQTVLMERGEFYL